MKRLLQFTFIVCLLVSGRGDSSEPIKVKQPGHNFKDPASQKYLTPYLLPSSHRMKPVLDKIFARGYPLESSSSLEKAGFKTLLVKKSAHLRSGNWRLAKHPDVPGYLFKIYLNSEKKMDPNEGWRRLAARCEGAANIRALIKQKKLRHMVVPEKWLYKVRSNPQKKGIQQPVILMVTDMNITSSKECREAWKKATKQQLNELHCVLSHGFASTFLVGNICYTRDGKFACLDTEVPKRKHNLAKVKSYLSHDMARYWDQIGK